jgi:hypothetical protein
MTLAVVPGLLALGLAASAQQPEKPAEKPAAPEAAPPQPQPGPEHAVLQNDEGTWDATVEMTMGPPGSAPTVSKGVETNTLVGGLWLVTDFKSTLMDQPFQGHGIAGWDPIKKKYVSNWVDTMSSSISLGESTYDAATKTMTGWMEGPDMTGKITKWRSVVEYKGPDTRVFTMFMPGPDGKEVQTLKITYKRRK